jgi:voltage-gated sodium channel
VIVSILELINIPALKLKSLRTLRVLRPLRSIKALPGMRKLITSLLRALPSLSYAVLFMIQIFLLFGILGI